MVRDKCSREVTQMDQQMVLELDKLVSDQQVTLERAGIPRFFITNKQEEVQLQMHLLEFIHSLANSPVT